MTSLPSPSFDALQHSQQLIALIKSKMIAQAGWLSFYDYMQLALYAPSLGYYAAGMQKFGAGGDFTTAPEMSPMFAKTCAQVAAPVLLETKADMLELGAGTGQLALHTLMTLAEKNALPQHYYILEVSNHLRQVQKETLLKLPESIVKRVQWLESLPDVFEGFIIANEVLDAIPVHLIHRKNGDIFERGVKVVDEELQWDDRPLTPETNPALYTEAIALELPDHYTTEICLAAKGLMTSLGKMLQKGAILMIDYGFSAQTYYHPQRHEGTLMCHYQQYAHADPLINVGLQDITAHVNFTQVAQAAVDAGLEMTGFSNQATFLINAGILALMEQVNPANVTQYAPMASAVQKLLSPAEMGELFNVIMFQKNLDIDVIGFQHGDRTHTL